MMTHDVIIIGAGPAGMAAAIEASSCGLDCLVLDEQPMPGGQIFRSIERRAQFAHVDVTFDRDQRKGLALVDRFREAAISYQENASVWDVSDDGRAISYIHQGQSQTMRSRATVIATGALERPVPIEGWQLPGVLSAGAAQTMLKTSLRPIAGRIVLVGCGPLLLLAARQLKAAGAEIATVLQTTGMGDYARAVPLLGAALARPALLRQGMKLFLASATIPQAHSVRQIRIVGEDRVRGVEYQIGAETCFKVCDTVLMHFGVIPNTEITRLAGAYHRWSPQQRYWYPVLDEWQETSIPGLMVAGDGGGIDGHHAAALAGRLAILRVANRTGRLSDASFQAVGGALRDELTALKRARAFVDEIYRVPEMVPGDRTIICRCEEVCAKDIRKAIKLVGSGLRSIKIHTRAGMGACRSRMCSLSIAALLAQEGHPESLALPATTRAPLRPLTVGQLANTLPVDQTARPARRITDV